MQQVRNTQSNSKRGMVSSQNLVGGQRSSNMTSSNASMGPSASSSSSSSSNMPYQGPMVLTPVSQLSNNPRRGSRGLSRPDGISRPDGMPYDPDTQNPDGSTRTMYRLPGFDQSYAQAMKAHYVRHPESLDREKELSVKEVFSKK